MNQPTKIPNLDGIAQKFELDLSRGIMKADGADDHARMMEAIEAYKAINARLPPLQEAMNMGRPAQPLPERLKRPVARSMVFSEAIKGYLAEKQSDNAKWVWNALTAQICVMSQSVKSTPGS